MAGRRRDVRGGLVAAAVWYTSPSLPATFNKFLADYQQSEKTSTMETWRRPE
jgi:hypothetical protein